MHECFSLMRRFFLSTFFFSFVIINLDQLSLTSVLSSSFSPFSPFPSHHTTSTGNLLKVTAGPDAGKLCLLDFGLVAEVPEPDREAMVSATIHLANRDWASLVDDFVALDFLPADCDRGVIIPVMDRVLSPYLSGGGAKAFNFQVKICFLVFAFEGEARGRDARNNFSPPSDPHPRHQILRQAPF